MEAGDGRSEEEIEESNRVRYGTTLRDQRSTLPSRLFLTTVVAVIVNALLWTECSMVRAAFEKDRGWFH